MRTLNEIADQLENYAVAPRPDLKSIASELREITFTVRHRLAVASVTTSTSGMYVCGCGASGITDMAPHLASRAAIKKRLVKNHELHATRSRVKELKI